MENGLGLVFVVRQLLATGRSWLMLQVVFPALLPLTYIPALLQRTKQLFLALFQPYLESLVDALTDKAGTITEGSISALRILGDKIVEERWERIFDRCLKNCEAVGGKKGGRTIVQRLAPTNDHADASCESNLSQLTLTPAAGHSDDNSNAVTAEEIAKNVAALKTRMKGRGKGRGKWV